MREEARKAEEVLLKVKEEEARLEEEERRRAEREREEKEREERGRVDRERERLRQLDFERDRDLRERDFRERDMRDRDFDRRGPPPLFLEVVRETDSTLSDEMKKTVVALETPVCSPEATAMAVTVDLVPPVPDLTTLARLPTIPNLLEEAAAAAACPCEIVLAPVIETSETCATATWTVVVPRCVDPFLPHHSVDLPLLSEVLPVDPLHLHSAGLAPFLLVTGILATENILFLLDVVVTLVLPGQPLRICCVGWAGGSITNWRNPCLLVPNSQVFISKEFKEFAFTNDLHLQDRDDRRDRDRRGPPPGQGRPLAERMSAGSTPNSGKGGGRRRGRGGGNAGAGGRSNGGNEGNGRGNGGNDGNDGGDEDGERR